MKFRFLNAKYCIWVASVEICEKKWRASVSWKKWKGSIFWIIDLGWHILSKAKTWLISPPLLKKNTTLTKLNCQNIWKISPSIPPPRPNCEWKWRLSCTGFKDNVSQHKRTSVLWPVLKINNIPFLTSLSNSLSNTCRNNVILAFISCTDAMHQPTLFANK